MAKDLVSLYHITSYYCILWTCGTKSGSRYWLSVIVDCYNDFLSTNRCLFRLPRPFATKEARSRHPRAYCHRRPYLAHHPAWCQLDPCHLSTKAITLLVQFFKEMTWSFSKHITLQTMGAAVLPKKKCHKFWDLIKVLRFGNLSAA